MQYDDGDFEEGVTEVNVKVVGENGGEEERKREEEEMGKRKIREKQRKAKKDAAKDMPFTFRPPPTTMEALDELVAEHCGSGEDVCTLVKRIHESNSVLVDKER